MIKVRLQVESEIHQYFLNQGFIHTRTPLLVSSPGMEPHIRPIEILRSKDRERVFLPTSPEFAMKKILAKGYDKIFQICSAFRDEPRSPQHLPEFTILEWYRAGCTYEAIMEDTEKLIETVVTRVRGVPELLWNGNRIDLRAPWPRITIESLFGEIGVPLRQQPDLVAMRDACKRHALLVNPSDTWDDLFFKLFLNKIEPALPVDRPVILYKYPPSQAALSVIEKDPDGTPWARRFEIFMGGLELANAFQELTDAQEQRARFEKDMALRVQTYGPSFPPNPIDEEFLQAVGQMPPCSGIALGVDRLVMLVAGEPDIANTVWLEPFF